MNPKAKLYAFQISRRKITILDVPIDLINEVLSFLSDSDRIRSEKLLNQFDDEDTNR